MAVCLSLTPASAALAAMGGQGYLSSMPPGMKKLAAMGGQGSLSSAPPGAEEMLEAACSPRGHLSLDKTTCRGDAGRRGLSLQRRIEFDVEGGRWSAGLFTNGQSLSVLTWRREGNGWTLAARQDDFAPISADAAPDDRRSVAVQSLDDGEIAFAAPEAIGAASDRQMGWRFLKFSPAQRQWSHGGALPATLPAAPGDDALAGSKTGAVLFDPSAKAGAWPALRLSFSDPVAGAGGDLFFEFDAHAGAYAPAEKPPIAGGRARLD